MEQRRIVELEPNGHMLIKGVAGSGKTTVTVLRAPFLLSRYCHEKDDGVLLVTYNKTLINYINYLYNKVETDEQLIFEPFADTRNNLLKTTIDSIMYKYFTYYMRRHKKDYKIAEKSDEFRIIVQAINNIKKDYPNIKILSPKNAFFLLDETEWIKACNISDVETYQNIDRIGRASGGSGTPQKLIKNSPLREAIFHLMEEYDFLLQREGLVDFKRMNLMALEQAKNNPMDKFTHILIDESQDLTKVQLEFLKCIYNEKKYSSIVFVADNTQSIYAHSWLGKGRAYTTIGYDMSGKSRILTKNYRTTTEISKAAFGLIEHDENIQSNVDFVKPSLIDRQGHPPIYRYFTKNEDQLSFLKSEIDILKGDYQYSEICIAAKEKRIIESAQSFLESKGIPCQILNQSSPDFESDMVKMVTIHSIKGLEFKVIFLIDLNEGIIPNNGFIAMDDSDNLDSDERKLLYVGMTRANELLYMSSVLKPSKFIAELNKNDLRMKRDSLIRPFRSLGTYDYKLKEQIIDINSKEEVVRQWMINELCEVYGYPLELLQIEYPVQKFSSKGYVDLAVSIFVKGEEIPYIFIEIKRFGSGVGTALSQLKSYMQTNEKVRYGLATDGVDIVFINQEGEILNDIPKCNPHFLPEKKKTKVYINLRNGKKYNYSYEKDAILNIDISDHETGLFLESLNKVFIPVCGEVVAGIPKLANEEHQEMINIPEDWLIDKNNSFVLKVTGDSMINAGIDKGDFVIINKQEAVNNGDIVIAVINEEATIKKFNTIGEDILLMAENPDYEAIIMKSSDVIINGKVIGIMKN